MGRPRKIGPGSCRVRDRLPPVSDTIAFVMLQRCFFFLSMNIFEGLNPV
ncbi:hypothetical protein V6Z12_D06G253500 [Gossypium hirsutum]